MTNHSKNLLLLTISTLLISTSGTLGKYIDTPIPVTIWFRCFVAGLALFAFCRFKGLSLNIKSKKDAASLIISGLFLGAHWLTYFYALKLSNVAIGMLSLFTFPIITAFLEPLFIKTKFDRMYIVLGLMVLLGIYSLAPEFNIQSSHVKGLVFGLISAVFYAMRNILSKKLTNTYSGTSVMLYQVSIVALVLLPTLFVLDTSNIPSQLPYLLILAILTTAVGHTMLVNSLKHFSVSTASIINSTQPIFGIIIAYLFLNEIPTRNTFIGGTLILVTVIIESIRSKKRIQNTTK